LLVVGVAVTLNSQPLAVVVVREVIAHLQDHRVVAQVQKLVLHVQQELLIQSPLEQVVHQ
jgi:hypothetical protein